LGYHSFYYLIHWSSFWGVSQCLKKKETTPKEMSGCPHGKNARSFS
jgi:hypothetical protein